MMSLSLTLFLSIFKTVFCVNCSATLLENLQKTFNLSDECGDCTILKPEIYFDNGNWSGLCARNRYLLFPEWECGNLSLVLISHNTCEVLNENNFGTDDDCLAQFIVEKRAKSKFRGSRVKLCKRSLVENTKGTLKRSREKQDLEFVSTVSSGTDSSFVIEKRLDANIFRQRTSTTQLTTPISTSESAIRTRRTSTESSTTERTEATEHTVTRKTNTPAKSTPTANPSSSQRVTETTKAFKSTKGPFSTPSLPKEICEANEFFFDNHCYFLRKHVKETSNDDNKTLGVLDSSENSRSVCSTQHPAALGLAVETEDENKFIIEELTGMYFLDRTLVLTSGIKTGTSEGVWSGWNQRVNDSVLEIGETGLNGKYYVINPCKGCWELWDGNAENRKVLTMCERIYNPKNVIEELYKQCVELYRSSSCYNKDKHAKYCCAKGEHGDIWFACPGETSQKEYQGYIRCFWKCETDGHFSPFRPICKGNIACHGNYKNITYAAPIMTFAISTCPKNLFGNSTWYCGDGKTFIGLPDYSLCCENASICRDTDVFLNAWAGCPAKKIVKKTSCPPGSDLKEAYVEWYCHSNGSFDGTIPDYSNCNRSDKRGCLKRDRYGVQWAANLGTTVYKDCPPTFTGQCTWKCKLSGEFDGAEPDCSWCRAKWMENIAEQIKSDSRHEEVISVMEEYTQKEDLRIGYRHVLQLTSECVTLYKKQSINEGKRVHHKFLKSYSKIFKNLAGSPALWSSFSVASRRKYAEDIVEITQDAAFANLESANATSESYNATLADLQTDGFDFFVAYNPSIGGSKFPPQNRSESEWHLEIKDVNERNDAFAAMALVMNFSLSSLMFPIGEELEGKEMNAPALTFAVALSRDGKAVVDHNVSVSVSFKHTHKTRFPESVEIGRRLHEGETPSGVFNSTICYYYSDSGWSSEGCSVTYTSKDRTDCVCSHLSTIGLLMTIHKYVPDKTLEIVSIASSGITIFSLILALLVFFLFDTVRNDRVLIGKNLCFCLLVGHVLLITVMDKRFFYIKDEFCKIYAAILHYVFMAAFAWMFVEGCHLYRMLVLVFDSNIEYRYVYLLIGYGAPLIVVGVTHFLGFAFQEEPYGQDELCWLKFPNYIWAFIGPVVVITSINFYILIIAMKLAISSRMRMENSNLSSLKLWLKGWFTLSSLLGITWLLGLALVYYNKILLYGFVVFNGLQGFFIFLFRCVLNEQYNDMFLKRIRSFSYTLNRKGDAVKSETKVIAISASKSPSSSEIKTKAEASDSEVVGGFSGGKGKSKSNVENARLNVNVEVTLKPTVSEAYLRNRMIAQNFAARRSKATWMNEYGNSR